MKTPHPHYTTLDYATVFVIRHFRHPFQTPQACCIKNLDCITSGHTTDSLWHTMSTAVPVKQNVHFSPFCTQPRCKLGTIRESPAADNKVNETFGALEEPVNFVEHIRGEGGFVVCVIRQIPTPWLTRQQKITVPDQTTAARRVVTQNVAIICDTACWIHRAL